MASKKTITVEGTEITLMAEQDSDYISLTDIDQLFEGNGRHIENWMRNQNTVEYSELGKHSTTPGLIPCNSMELERKSA